MILRGQNTLCNKRKMEPVNHRCVFSSDVRFAEMIKEMLSVQRVLFAYGAQLLPAEQLCKCKWLNLFCCILQNADSDPDQELTDAAATAQSLQPRGFTLETTDVRIRLLLNVLCYVT